jgi:hypothetical protein
MGTNYYVRPPQGSAHCKHCGHDQEIHLGKSSGGWRFLHRAYRDPRIAPGDVEWPVIDRASWMELLDLGPIFDEYGREHDRVHLLALIDSMQVGIAHVPYMREHHPSMVRDGHDFEADGYDFCDMEFS